MSDNTSLFPAWAIIELFGHQQIAGWVSLAELGGEAFLRVDVPAVNGTPEFTKVFNPRSVYGINFVDETIALEAAANIHTRPVTIYTMASLQDEFNQRLEAAKESYRRRLEHEDDDIPL